ncbi:response regulator [Ruminococcaceae bacterium OttesenSCG-928-D13]|nr:response regulator [Ruminococcaceae bacterium OttesenSCG-928-D13]
MYKAVIVDDEEVIVAGLSKLLPWEKYGCRVVGTAGGGLEALALVREQHPHILFTDIRMPGMDGLALIAALRSEFPEMQVTILSGYPEFDYAQRAIRLGVTSYILKPSRMQELEEALAQMVARLDAAEVPGENAPDEMTPPAGDAEGAPAPLPAGPASPEDTAGNFIIKNAIQYIEAHYAEKLSLPQVAEQVYVSQWHLSKLIARNTGQSFSDLLNGVRIARAKELLEDPALRIWEISEQVGFSDVTHFSRIFKKLENQSANEYRNRLSGG